ncbi:MAG: VOC family protein, partial [Anaerolineae bacterium]
MPARSVHRRCCIATATRPNVDQQITFLYTRDLASTAHFYEDIMSLPMVLDQGDCRIYHTCGDAYVGFCERTGAPQTWDDEKAHGATHAPPASFLYTLVTDQVDAWYSHLRRHGVEIESPPKLNETYGIYHFFVRDPNGYVIEIQRFTDPDWCREP